MQTDQSKHRIDIQLLRGVAVLQVVAYHAKLFPIKAGYLGVDVFFVVSGFLITGLITNAIKNKRFSLAEFYQRRAKRLLPAAYVTFALTSLASVFILSATELEEFAAQLFGAVTFTGNIVLWRQSGYFEGVADLKPLLHVWSLSIEEQYYLLLPAALVVVPRRFWLVGAIFLVLSSLSLCLWLVVSKPVSAFFLLPTRAWELALGSTAALLSRNQRNGMAPIVGLLFWPSIGLLIGLPFFPLGDVHPGLDAILICTATAVIVLRQYERFSNNVIVGPLKFIGDISYSLYLTHWPLFALINNAYVGEPSLLGRFLGLIASFLSAYYMHKLIEKPIRNRSISFRRRDYAMVALVSILLVAFPFAALATMGQNAEHYKSIRTPNFGLSKSCDFKTRFVEIDECQTSAKPQVLVWGDSFSMHLVPGIRVSGDDDIVQATRSSCAPFLEYGTFDNLKRGADAVRSCSEFNQSVLTYLKTQDSIKVVVLSGRFGEYVNRLEDGREWTALIKVNDEWKAAIPTVPLAVDAMVKTIETIRSLGKRVVLVGPPPASTFDIGKCLERMATGKVILDMSNGCDIPVPDYMREQRLTLEFLGRLSQVGRVKIVDLGAALCSDSHCSSMIDNNFVYRDASHLSYVGASALGRKISLGRLIHYNAE